MQTVIVDETNAKAQAKYKEFRDYVSVEGALALLSGWLGCDFGAYRLDTRLSSVKIKSVQAGLRRSAVGFCRLRARQRSGGNILYPAGPHLVDRIWQATVSAAGGERAGEAGDGLMLSRTQPRPKVAPDASLADLQHPIIDAYLAALPRGRVPRIMASRTLFVADDRKEARRLADIGLSRVADHLVETSFVAPGQSCSELIAALDMHVGTADEAIASLRADSTLDRVTDLVFQVHSVDPPHAHILRSIELIAECVAPALGWEQARAGEGNHIALAT